MAASNAGSKNGEKADQEHSAPADRTTAESGSTRVLVSDARYQLHGLHFVSAILPADGLAPAGASVVRSVGLAWLM
jgi:hypothetical protein